MCCTADQFINCAAFDELCNIWSIAQCTYNKVMVMDRFGLGLGLGLVLELGLG